MLTVQSRQNKRLQQTRPDGWCEYANRRASSVVEMMGPLPKCVWRRAEGRLKAAYVIDDCTVR
jgi:hypothetical protein